MTQRGSERLRERRIVWFPTRGAAGRLCQTCRVGVHPAQGTWRLTHTRGGGERRRTPGRVADQGRGGAEPLSSKGCGHGPGRASAPAGCGRAPRPGPQGPSGAEAPASQPRQSAAGGSSPLPRACYGSPVGRGPCHAVRAPSLAAADCVARFQVRRVPCPASSAWLPWHLTPA